MPQSVLCRKRRPQESRVLNLARNEEHASRGPGFAEDLKTGTDRRLEFQNNFE
jgi:hypothetical protein